MMTTLAFVLRTWCGSSLYRTGFNWYFPEYLSLSTLYRMRCVCGLLFGNPGRAHKRPYNEHIEVSVLCDSVLPKE